MEFPSLTDFAAMADRLAPLLLAGAGRSVVLLALAALTTLALRRRSAAVRHWVWMLAFAGLLLLPLLSAVLPGWRVLPRLALRTSVSPAADINVTPPTPAALPQDPILSQEPPANAADASPDLVTANPPPALVDTGTAASPPPQPAEFPSAAALGSTASAPPLVATTAASRISTPNTPLPWTFWLAALWLGGTLVVLGQMALGYASLWFLKRHCTPLDQGHWSTLLTHHCRTLNIRRPIQLLSSPRRTMPMTWGLVRTYVLLPEQASAWPVEQRHAVLLHELGHACRWDCLTQLLAQIACALYWFNPIVWVACGRMQAERERACDDLVLSAGARASTYAQHLLRTASALPALRFVGAAVAMARPSTLEERLRAILDPQRSRHALSTASGVATFLLLMLALVPMAALRAQQNPAPRPSPTSPVPPVAGYPADGSVPLPPGSTESLETRMAERRGAQLAADRRAAAAPSNPVSNATCALDATIYDVRIPIDKVGQIDPDALNSAAADAATFEKKLAQLGAPLPLYRATQSIRLAGDSITISTQTPYVTNSQVSTAGQPLNSVSYTSTGAIFNFAGKTAVPKGLELDLKIELSALSQGPTAISNNVNAPVFRSAILVHKGSVEARRPFVLVSVDAASLDQTGKAVAYIARVTLGPPQSDESGK